MEAFTPHCSIMGCCEATRAGGALVAGFTPVTSVRREAHGLVVDTARGSLGAKEVIATTNGYTGRITPGLASRVVPIPSFVMATEPLGQNRVRSLIPKGRMIVETNDKHRSLRPSPDATRVVMGGRAALHPIPLDEAARGSRKSCAPFSRRSRTFA